MAEDEPVYPLSAQLSSPARKRRDRILRDNRYAASKLGRGAFW